MWGLSEDGNFHRTTDETTGLRKLLKIEHVDVHRQVHADLLRTRKKAVSEIKHIFEASDISDSAKGRRLLLLWHQDLLPGVSGQILDSTSMRDLNVPLPVSRMTNVLGWCFVLGVNCAYVFYIYLFALTQQNSAQQAWFNSFILWFIMEVFFVSSGIVFFVHFLLPSFTMGDIKKIRAKLLYTLEKAEGEHSETTDAFNVANFFFVSTRIAKLYPNLRESKIVLKFESPWPRQSYNHIKKDDKAARTHVKVIGRSLGLIGMLLVSNVLETTQVMDMGAEWAMTSIMGFVFIGHIDLYNINHLLVVLPLLLMCIIVHFLIFSDRTRLEHQLHNNEIERLARVKPKLSKESVRMPVSLETCANSAPRLPSAMVNDMGNSDDSNDSDDDVSSGVSSDSFAECESSSHASSTNEQPQLPIVSHVLVDDDISFSFSGNDEYGEVLAHDDGGSSKGDELPWEHPESPPSSFGSQSYHSDHSYHNNNFETVSPSPNDVSRHESDRGFRHDDHNTQNMLHSDYGEWYCDENGNIAFGEAPP